MSKVNVLDQLALMNEVETGAGFLIVGNNITSTPEGGKPNN